MSNFFLPLMNDNIDKEDVDAVINFLSQEKLPKLTNGPKVVEFENAWGSWLGTKYNLLVAAWISGTISNGVGSNIGKTGWCQSDFGFVIVSRYQVMLRTIHLNRIVQ